MLKFQGLAAAPGIAVGPAWIYQPVQVTIERCQITDPDLELQRLESALQMAREQLGEVYQRALKSLGLEEAAIFEAHQLFLEDEEFLGSIRQLIAEERLNAEAAVSDGVEKYSLMLECLSDEYFQARAQDVRDVGRRVIYCLFGINTANIGAGMTEPAIVLAEDLTPSDTVQLDKSKLLGLCTLRGGPTSHTAILARSLGVPAVVRVQFDLEQIEKGTLVILDGLKGLVLLAPTQEEIEQATKRRDELKLAQARQLASAHQPTATRDGHAVEAVANIGGADDAIEALKFGAEGVGLFRTEFLYLDRDSLPSEEEQVTAYRKVVEIMAGRPLVVRTLDIGGDKAVPYLGLTAEPNPFLGWRAIRMIDERPDVLYSQLRALLLAGVGADLRIMLPMVSSIDEVRAARKIFDQARQSLLNEGKPFADKVQFGIMVEVPSAALLANHLADVVDFFSIGTNDLTQYTVAVDRTNERVADIASPFHPGVIQLIAHTIREAHVKGIWVGLCGEMAGDPQATQLLIGLGLDEFSMAPPSIPAFKEIVRKCSTEECKEIAQHALQLPTTKAVQNYLKSEYERLS